MIDIYNIYMFIREMNKCTVAKGIFLCVFNVCMEGNENKN